MFINKTNQEKGNMRATIKKSDMRDWEFEKEKRETKKQHKNFRRQRQDKRNVWTTHTEMEH